MNPDGSPLYTIPAIYDSATGVGIAESWRIAEYLDRTYPNTPPLFPNGTHVLQLSFRDLFYTRVLPLFKYTIADVPTNLNPISAVHFAEARSAEFGVPSLAHLRPSRPELKAEAWRKVIEGLGAIDSLMKDDAIWVMGDRPSFADFIIGSAVGTVKTIYGEESLEWRQLTSCHNGRWGRLMQYLKKYSEVD